MSDGTPIIFLLDDEPGVVAELGRLLRVSGFAIRTWTSEAEFLNAHDGKTPGCLVIAVRMSGMSGLEVQRVLLARGIDRPTIFITGEGDVRTTVLGMKAGAVTFLTKPVQPAELIGAVREALARDATRRAHSFAQADLSARLARLTPRERQVFSLLTLGLLNKQIAAELRASETTIKAHRRHILSKMEVRSATALMGLLYRRKFDVQEVARSNGARGKLPISHMAVARGGRLRFGISRAPAVVAAPCSDDTGRQHHPVPRRAARATAQAAK